MALNNASLGRMTNMKRKLIYFFVFPLFLLMLLVSFISDNGYFSISQKDVEFHIPKGFPQPFYDIKKKHPHSCRVCSRQKTIL